MHLEKVLRYLTVELYIYTCITGILHLGWAWAQYTQPWAGQPALAMASLNSLFLFLWMEYLKPSSSTISDNRLEHSFYKTTASGCHNNFHNATVSETLLRILCSPLVSIPHLWLLVKLLYMHFLFQDFVLRFTQKTSLRLSLFHFCADFIVRHGQYIFP